MLTQEEYEKVIRRQDESAEQLDEILREFDALDDEMRALLLKLPQEKLQEEMSDYLSNLDPDPMVAFMQIIDFRLKNPELTAKKHEQLIKHPEYKEYVQKRPLYDELKYRYYVALFNHYKMINDDRMTLFDDHYTALMDGLADRGLFAYFQQTPDFEFTPEMSADEAENYVLDYYSQNKYFNLTISFVKVFQMQTNNPLQINKTNDLGEALLCLTNECYQSCARTMFALLENEHNNASSLYKRTNGAERSKQIDGIVKEAGIDYYLKAWQKIDAYYKTLNCDTDKMDKNALNRHDLMHGKYLHRATGDDCVRLILMYASFKEISFYLQQMIDFRNELAQDGMIYLIRELENKSNNKTTNKKKSNNKKNNKKKS